jgi:hypothetical protein
MPAETQDTDWGRLKDAGLPRHAFNPDASLWRPKNPNAFTSITYEPNEKGELTPPASDTPRGAVFQAAVNASLMSLAPIMDKASGTMSGVKFNTEEFAKAHGKSPRDYLEDVSALAPVVEPAPQKPVAKKTAAKKTAAPAAKKTAAKKTTAKKAAPKKK